MRILHCITTISRGGAENHLLELARGQRDLGHDIMVAYLKGDGYWRSEFECIGVRVHPLQMVRYGAVRPAVRLRRLVRDFRPNLIHAHMPPAELYARAALIGYRARPVLIISKHVDLPFFDGPFSKLLGTWVAARASAVIAISQSVNTYMASSLDLRPPKVRTIYYGLRVPENHPAPEQVQLVRRAWGANVSDLLFGTVARLVPQKALHVLLEGYAHYRTMMSRTSRLVIVGTGPLELELKGLARKLGLEPYVVWAGFREDIPVVMRALDVFVLTSVCEGFGLVLLEAMMAERAVVASKVSAIPEVVENNRTGFLVPPSNPEALASSFLQMEDDALRERMGRAGRQRAQVHFSVDKMVEQTLAIYEEHFLKG